MLAAEKTNPIGSMAKDTVPTKSIAKSTVTVKTRSMAEKEDSLGQIETPRDMSSPSPVVTMMSPVTVHNDTLISGSSDSEPPIASEYDLTCNDKECDVMNEMPSDSDNNNDSEIEDSDPNLAPGCFNKECSYGGGLGSRATGIRVYECMKCNTGVCIECYDEGTAHSGHRKYLKLIDT